jgi:PKD repeat protein
MAFYTGADYPSAYQGALFFADYSRNCIYVIQQGSDGEPDLNTRTAFESNAPSPVDLQIGPGGDIYYVDHNVEKIHRISFTTQNQPPVAVAAANPTAGMRPMTVQFDGSGSSDPNPGTTLFYKWDLNGDGQYDDSSIVNPTFTYDTDGTITVGLQVTDDDGASDTDQIEITTGNRAPTAIILNPSNTALWKVGDSILFSGKGDDPDDGVIPDNSMYWQIILHHCPAGGGCHIHNIQDYDGISSGIFPAPDHEYPSYLEIRLTVLDAGGLSASTSVDINPAATQMIFHSNPAGAAITAGDLSGITNFSRNAIVNSTMSISATTPQMINGILHYFVSWSDGGLQTHDVLSQSTTQTFTALFAPCIVPSQSVPVNVNHTQLNLIQIPNAASYDVIRGDLQILRSTGGNFTQATRQCVANDQSGTTLPFSATPAPGEAYFFLARGTSCGGNGSYASAGSQLQNPDSQINASLNACP